MALGGDDAPTRALGRKRPRETSHLPTRRKIKMEPPEDKENQPPNAASEPLESLLVQLPEPNARYSDTQGQPTQLMRFGESARSLFMLEKPSERRLRLVIALKQAPRAVDTWLELLRCPLAGNPGKYSKVRLLQRALTCVDSPEAREGAGYTEMCIMLAKLSDTEAGVRQNFLEMRKRRVGEKQPLLYEEEAAFEYAAGNKMVAEEILERAVDNDAMTPNEKEELLRRVLAGRAGWVAAFSGSPQEQKLLALKARVLALRKIQKAKDTYRTQDDKGAPSLASTPLHRQRIVADTTPISCIREKDVRTPAPLHTSTPSSVTPVSHGRSGIGFSTVSKVPRNSNKSPLLTTPSLPTRSNLKSQSTSRKTHQPSSLFRLGAPLRVIASNDCTSDDDDDDDDNAMIGSQITPPKPSKPMTPIKEKTPVLKYSSPSIKSESKTKLKIDKGDIAHILTWKPKDKGTPTDSKDIKTSGDPPVKPTATVALVTSTLEMPLDKKTSGDPPIKPTATGVASMATSQPEMPLVKENEAAASPTLNAGVAKPQEISSSSALPASTNVTSIKPSARDQIRSPGVQRPFESRVGEVLGTDALAKRSASRTLDHYRSPKRQQLDPSVAVAKSYADMSSPTSVSSSSSSPPVATMTSASSRDALESLTSRIVVNGKKYIKLEQIGSGGSSKVYRMLGPDLKIYALKKIKLKRLDAESIAQYTNEINLLSKLQGNPHIIELIAAEQDLQQRQINVIMEHGEIDLSERLRDLNGGMDENLVRVIWTQMLQAVDAIHTARIIHGDLKPANFLFVNGALKLIDFGIAKAISNDTTNIERDSQIGTVNFMSPEAIQGNTMPNGQRHPEGKMKVGRASDIWSLGCILYQIVYSKPPFADVHSIIEKFRCIIDPAVPIPFPALKNKDLEDVIRSCLQRDHRRRPPITGEGGLLEHPFLRSGGSSATVPPTTSVTVTNASEVLSQLGDLLRSRGVATSRVNMFMSIGQEGLRNSNNGVSRTHRYFYNTQERRTDI
ncbi:hypothetical protein PRNP1_012769 [Phytophthora ramorum]